MKKLIAALTVLITIGAGSAAALAADSSDEGSAIEEIVITAQKRTERLADVPVSASVVSTEELTKLNIGDISDLNRVVPSVNLNGTINGRVPYGIRGISTVSNEFTVGVSQGVAVMIDGVPIPSDSRAGNAIEDVQSIEVLKGPQQTFGGRSAASGIINIITHKPTDSFEGTVKAMATTDSEYRINGFVSGPLTDVLDYSLAGYYTTRDFPITNTQRDKKTNERIYGARGKLLFKPNDRFQATLTARVGSDNSTGFNFVYTHLTPGIYLLTGAGGPPFMSQDYMLPGINVHYGNLEYYSPVHVYSDVSDHDASLDMQYQFGNGVALSSTTAYQHEKQANIQDLFAVADYFWNLLTGAPGSGAPPFYNIQEQYLDLKQFSEEVKLVSPADRPLSYVLGVFYSDTKIDEVTRRDLLPALQDEDVHPTIKTTDIYGNVNWEFVPQNHLLIGARYNYDQLGYTLNVQGYDYAFPPPNIFFTTAPIRDSSSEGTAVGDISLQHKFSGGGMAYAKYARGYSPAVYNTSQGLTGLTPAESKLGLAKKETIDSFEIGAKTSFLDGALGLDVAVFYTKYNDFQAQVFDESSVSINPPLILVNGGAKTQGIELDGRWNPARNTHLSLSMAYTDATFTSYPDAPCYYPTDAPGNVPPGCFTKTDPVSGATVIVQDLNGKTMPNSPKFKAVFDAEQRVPTGSGLDWVLGLNVSYRDSVQMLTDQNPYAIQPSLVIANLNVGVEKGGFAVSAFVNNIFDKHYYTDLEDFWSGPWGGTDAVIGQPARDARRYAGLRVSMKF